jgi:hypothetical protein
MGISEDQYPEVKKLNKWVIKDPVEEINQVTDFYVAPDYQRTQRKVTAVKFKVRRMLQLPGQHSRQESLLPDYEDAPMVWELKNAGLSAEEAWKIWQQGFECVDPAKRPEGIEWDTYLHEKIDLLKRRRADGKVKSITGFLLKAIKENYTNAELTEAKQQQASKQQARTKYDQARQRQTLEDEKTQLEKAHRSDIHNICKRLIADRPALADEAVQALLQDNAQFKKQYNPMKTFTENYEKGMFLWAWVDPYLEKQHPDHFETARATYVTRLQKIGDTLASLKQSSL